ncbi:PepSY domain-containing protein [Micrococcus sp.]|uniref:PepSY domain-containing protein n=1 Tax=Micrococcus sp. TaxID=1271 RepID=UPI002A90D6AD|nr:PepSY domain-containing protein [Micrococcus sp.]MDY6054710.1 PepSY domain-containing protein [Micrococcus sp.]
MTSRTRSLALSGSALLAAAVLAGCGTQGEQSAQSAASVATSAASEATSAAGSAIDVATSSPSADGSASTAPASESGASSAASTSAASTTAAASSAAGSAAPTATAAVAPGARAADGADPAYAAIDTVLAQYDGGIIVEMDLSGDGLRWEVDVVTGDQVKELDVTSDGVVTETDRDADQDDVRKARDAQVTAEQAVSTALLGREDQRVDEVDLSEDDGRLTWEVELDRADRSSGAELTIDARTGEILAVDEG